MEADVRIEAEKKSRLPVPVCIIILESLGHINPNVGLINEDEVSQKLILEVLSSEHGSLIIFRQKCSENCSSSVL